MCGFFDEAVSRLVTVLYSPDHGGALPGDVVEVVVLVVQIVANVRFEGRQETVLDIGIAVIEARIGWPGVELIAGEARIEARRHQVLVAHQLSAERSQRDAQVEAIDEALRKAGVSREIGQDFLALRREWRARHRTGIPGIRPKRSRAPASPSVPL